MEILITGNTQHLTEGFYRKFTSFAKIVLCNPRLQKMDGVKAEVYRYAIAQEDFARFFRTYSFDVVIYFSYLSEEETNLELTYLDTLFRLCKTKKQMQFIYVRPNDTVLSLNQKILSQVCAKAGQELCEAYAKEGHALCMLQTPILVAKKKVWGWMEQFLSKAAHKEAIEISLRKDQFLDFLFLEDLANLMVAILEEEETGLCSYELYGGNEETVEEILDKMSISYERNLITYGSLYAGTQTEPALLRQRYGWFPKNKLEDYLEGWMKKRTYIHPKSHQTTNFLENRRRFLSGGIKKNLFIILEFIVMFMLSEYLTFVTKGSTVVNFADFRLFFIMICGLLYGLNMGLAAAIASCIAYVFTSGMDTNWQIQLYNIINWIPFATYILLGAMLGHTKEKYEASVNSAIKSQDIMEKKYVYLNELYLKVLENKEKYSSQIVNYQDSFGRIYAATQKLDTVNASELFYQALVVLEDMLSTKSVAIYSLDGDRFARLNVCSKDLSQELTKSIVLSEMEECMERLRRKETWVNRQRMANCPDYAYGIFHEGSLQGMIFIWHADFSQMSIEFLNRFNILSGLISASLIRANQYQELAEGETMIEGTKIMKYEFFVQQIEAQKKLKQGQLAAYALLRVCSDEQDYRVESDRLSHVIRKNDIAGVDKNGAIYILLTQAKDEDRENITKRMLANGIQVEWMEDGNDLSDTLFDHIDDGALLD